MENYCAIEEREYALTAFGREQHELMMTHATRRSYSKIKALFDPEKDGHIPRTVVLQGAAGIGKTMTARKIMLDWASGELFRGRFDYVVYVQCREHNQLVEQKTVEELLNHGSEVGPLLTLEAIEADPQKVLFIIDGFDELIIPRTMHTNKPDKTLVSLIRRCYLAKAHLLITTRATALGSLEKCLERVCDERFAEILGFSEDDRKEYFIKFFQNKTQALRAFNIVKQNDILFTMCFVPIICWIVCKAIKQLRNNEDCLYASKTTTSLYMQFLSSLATQQSTESAQRAINGNLKKLCALAQEGICRRKILFQDEDLAKHKVDIPAIQSLFLTNDLFQKDDANYNVYSFIHLTFQEFFAALFYILEGNEDRAVIDLLKDIVKTRTCC